MTPYQHIQRGHPSYRLYQSILSLVMALGFALLFGRHAQANNLGTPDTTLSPAFGISVAGLTLQLDTPQQLPDGSFHARKAKLGAPTALGGGSVEVNDVTVKDGKVVSIGGGEFRLPLIRVGPKESGFVLDLRGKLARDDNDDLIVEAEGTFTAPNLGTATGCKGITVKVILAQVDDDLTLLTLQPPAADAERMQVMPSGPYVGTAPDGVVLRQAMLRLDCAIPIGATGFDLKSVQGTVTLNPGSTTIEIAATIATTRQVLGTPIVSAEGQIKLTTDPFSLALHQGVKLFTLPVASGDALITPRSFSGTLRVELTLMKGSVTVNSWVDSSTEFHLTGKGYVEVGLTKGSVRKKCLIKLGKLRICPKIPPRTVRLGGVEVQAGEFRRLGGDEVQAGELRNGAWGFRGSFRYKKYGQGFYVDSEGQIKFGNVDEYQLVEPEEIEEAHAAWSGALAAGVDAAAASAGYHFASPASAFPLTITTPITLPSDLILMLSRQGQNPQLSLVMPDGTVVTPDTLPENIDYVEEVNEIDDQDEAPATQLIYTVADAEPGDWLAVLIGEPEAEELYQFEVIGHPTEPVLEVDESDVLASGEGGATVTWRLRSNSPETYVAIFANPGPITETFVIDNSDGTTATVELPLYLGYELAEDIPAQTDNTPQSHPVDTSFLPSGTYRVWLEIDDEINDPVQVYLAQPLVVDHSSDFGETWTPTVTVEAGFNDLYLDWTAHSSPDVDYYIVYIGEEPGTATPEDAVDSFIVGYSDDFYLVGLDGNETLYIAIGAYVSGDDDGTGDNGNEDDGVRSAQSGRQALSPEIEVKTLAVEFDLTPSATAMTLASGGSAPLTLNLSSPLAELPDEIYLYEDCLFDDAQPSQPVYLPLIIGSGQGSHTLAQEPTRCRASHGLNMTFEENHFKPTADGLAVMVTIHALDTPPGEYLMPIVAESNNTIVSFDLHVTVTAGGAAR
jgi:hypothetical protein